MVRISPLSRGSNAMDECYRAHTLGALTEALARGTTTSEALVERALAAAEDPCGEGARVFIKRFADAARAEADASDARRRAGRVWSPLDGIPLSIKDLMDVAGHVTLAGSRVRYDAAPATRDATVVSRLRAAGAVIVGTTNMTEFAVGTPGTNPHYGTPRNPWNRATGHIPGGSSSGCAVSITDGMAAAGLGTDTAGSVRVPAALCGLVGYKSTAARVPLDGVFPYSRSLDSVGVLGHSVACCATVAAVVGAGAAAARTPVAPLTTRLRLGVLKPVVDEALEPAVTAAYSDALDRLAIDGVDLEPLHWDALSRFHEQALGPRLAAIEGFAVHREMLEARGAQYDPHVRATIAGGDAPAWQYIELLRCRETAIADFRTRTTSFDAVVLPTVPMVAPPITSLADPARWREVRARLLRNNVIGNLLDACAITLPCHRSGEAPVGLMLMAPGGTDMRLLAVAASVEPRVRTMCA